MKLETHLEINSTLCGKVIKLSEGYAEVLLHTSNQMRADEQGLVHGGFVFGAADFAAMSAVNDPNVVLGSSSSKFLAPLRVSDVVLVKAKVVKEKGKKKEVSVEAFVKEKPIFEGSFVTFVLDTHVLEEKK